jgi:hypothetical protein
MRPVDPRCAACADLQSSGRPVRAAAYAWGRPAFYFSSYTEAYPGASL